MAEEEVTGSIDFSGYEEVKAGEKEDTKVVSVTKGKQSDFRSEAYWDKIEDTPTNIRNIKNQDAIEVKTANSASIVINLPESKKVNPRSNLALWKKTYGDYPAIDQEVRTKTDEFGFNRIVLEK